MQLIAIDLDDNLQYYDKFRLRIDSRRTNEHLIIMPSENEKDFIYISFKRNYVHQNAFQRILCIDECEIDSNRYLLIFVNVEKCVKFIESIKNGKAKDKLLITVLTDDEIFKTKYLTPIATTCQENPLMEEELQPLLLEFLEFYKTREEKSAATEQVDGQTLFENNGITPTEISNSSSQKDEESNERRKSLRTRDNNVNYRDDNTRKRPLKRSFSTKERQQGQHTTKNQKLPPLDKIIHAPNLKFIRFIKNGISKSRLFIFPNSDKSSCYEYYYSTNDKYYLCAGCFITKKRTPAVIQQNSNGKDFVKCLRIDHLCELRQFQAENYQSDLIIKKPNYEAVEEIINDNTKKYLLLYTSADKKNYFKLIYIDRKKLYKCRRCDTPQLKISRKYITARICHDEDGNEFVYVRNTKHACANMEYLEYQESTYNFINVANVFVHQKLNESRKTNMKKFIKQSRTDQPKISSTSQFSAESRIIKKPNYQLFQRRLKRKGIMIKKLAVFDSNDATMCYKYTWSNSKQVYVCQTCKNKFSKNVTAKIIKHGDEDEYVQMGKHDHMCDLQKFDC